jgi:glutathione peroxidase
MIVGPAYVTFVNRNSMNMTTRQKILKAIYPITMWFTQKTGKNLAVRSELVEPLTSIYSLTATLTNGERFPMQQLKGKKIMIVNTASDCGYTGQYDGLEKLYQEHKNQLVILAFPSNDFKEQEKGTDESIATFCKLNYGISFPLMKKSIVLKNAGQNEIFSWLTEQNHNGWNNQAPSWNFCKYIVDEQGRLLNCFPPSVEPSSAEVLDVISK